MELDDDLIYLNGLSGDQAGYSMPPFLMDSLRQRAREMKPVDILGGEEIVSSLEMRENAGLAHLDLSPDADPDNLADTGWAILFNSQVEEKNVKIILEALGILVQHRKQQAGPRFRVFSGKDGYEWGESGEAFAGKHGLSPGTVNPSKIPYYLLLIGGPESIPFQFQYELDIQFAVGRIDFNSIDDYSNYANNVVLAETPGHLSRSRQAVFFATSHPDDRATQLSAELLAKPLYHYTLEKSQRQKWLPPILVSPDQANKRQLSNLLGNKESPALLFSATHGVGWSAGDSRQIPFQGALVCQEWPGPVQWQAAPDRSMYLAAEDVTGSPVGNQGLLGCIAFFFACFSAGTPNLDDYALAQNRQRVTLSPKPFIAELPKRLLSRPGGGALAVIGHVERAWGYSYRWKDVESEPESFKAVIYQLMRGMPVGYAMEHVNQRYAQIAASLAYDLGEARFNPRYDPKVLGYHWMAHNDARGYAIIGDPAVRILPGSSET